MARCDLQNASLGDTFIIRPKWSTWGSPSKAGPAAQIMLMALGTPKRNCKPDSGGVVLFRCFDPIEEFLSGQNGQAQAFLLPDAGARIRGKRAGHEFAHSLASFNFRMPDAEGCHNLTAQSREFPGRWSRHINVPVHSGRRVQLSIATRRGQLRRP